MVLRALSRVEVRELDRRAIERFSIPGTVLMENAGREAARWLADLGVAGLVLVCCGKGNNGGDGYVMARHLEAWGHNVHVLLACDPAELSGEALVHFQILKASETPVTRWNIERTDHAVARMLQSADWIVDALLGTGIVGEVREPLSTAIELINSCPARRLSIDIPSGLDCDTGRPLGIAVRATHTATFVATKLGFTNAYSAEFTGAIRVFDIGLPRRLLHEYKR